MDEHFDSKIDHMLMIISQASENGSTFFSFHHPHQLSKDEHTLPMEVSVGRNFPASGDAMQTFEILVSSDLPKTKNITFSFSRGYIIFFVGQHVIFTVLMDPVIELQHSSFSSS